MLESLFQAYNFVKKRIQHRSFPLKFVKFKQAPFSRNSSGGCFLPLWTNNDKSYVSLQKWCSSWQRKLPLIKFIGSYVKVFEKLHFNKINGSLAACLSDVMTDFRRNNYTKHSVKGVQIRSFFWSVFSRIRTEYGEIRSIWTLFTKWTSLDKNTRNVEISFKKKFFQNFLKNHV